MAIDAVTVLARAAAEVAPKFRESALLDDSILGHVLALTPMLVRLGSHPQKHEIKIGGATPA